MPMTSWSGAVLQPPMTQYILLGPATPKRSRLMAMLTVSTAKRHTHTVSQNLFMRRLKSAYRILARYSHCNDHVGPLSGLVSCHPLISQSLPTGIIVQHHKKMSSTVHHGVLSIRGKAELLPR